MSETNSIVMVAVVHDEKNGSVHGIPCANFIRLCESVPHLLLVHDGQSTFIFPPRQDLVAETLFHTCIES